MSRRSAEANKAIAAKWEAEQALVKEGKGTRDWTPEQQKSILERGKAYDENGRAFEGQHMKSVEAYPDYQGDPNNIQLLSREEHLEAHDHNWQNPTNWYFDPITKEKTDFGEGPPIPCDIIKLKNPVVVSSEPGPGSSESGEKQTSEERIETEPSDAKTSDNNAVRKSTPISNPKPDLPFSQTKKKQSWATRVKEAYDTFTGKHPVITSIGKQAIKTLGREMLYSAVGEFSSRISFRTQSSRKNGSAPASTSIIKSSPAKPSVPSTSAAPPTTRTYPTERSSPGAHTVRGHSQRYGKNKVLKEKAPYKRGGKK